MNEKKPTSRAPGRGIFVVLGIATAVWIAAVVWLAWKRGARNLPLNELGDFLAGSFAPPAFLWLIAGYFLQARELRAQIEEMRQHVEATRDMVAHSEERIRREWRLHQPNFEFLQMSANDKATFINTGKEARSVSLHVLDPATQVGILLGDSRVSIRDTSVSPGEHYSVMVQSDGRGSFSLRYEDVIGSRGEAVVQREGGFLFRVVKHQPLG